MIIKINGSVNINNTKISTDNLSIEINGSSINKKEEEKNLPREAKVDNTVDNTHVTNAVTEATINNKDINYNHIADMVMEGSTTKEDLQNTIADLIKKVVGKTDMDTILFAARKIIEAMASVTNNSNKNDVMEAVASTRALLNIMIGELAK